jgi:TMEM175 potassium channel family protein
LDGSFMHTQGMETHRLEAFSDGVLAVIITIIVLELKVPAGHTLHDAATTTGQSLLTYLLSFIYIGIYWNNHHHMFQLIRRVDGKTLWANLHLLFWLSLVPFITAWMDESHFARTPVMTYGVNLLAAAVAYFLLQSAATASEGPDSPLRRALGADIKGKLSPLAYLVGIGAAAVNIWVGIGLFTAVAIMWLVPDKRMERFLAEHSTSE